MILLVAGLLATTANAQQPTIEGKNNRLVVTGGSTTFIVDVSGAGPFSYQWQHDGMNLPDNIIITAAGDGTQGYLGDGGAATQCRGVGRAAECRGGRCWVMSYFRFLDQLDQGGRYQWHD